MAEVKVKPAASSDEGDDETIFNVVGNFIETNLITEDDIKSYRIHVATEEGLKGAPLVEALPQSELEKIIKKRKKYAKNVEEVKEEVSSVEKLKERILSKDKKKKKKKSKSRSPEKERKKRKSKSRSTSRSKKRKSKSKSRSRSKSMKRSKSEKKPGRRSRSSSRSRRRSSPNKGRRKSRSSSRSRRRKSRSRSRRRSRSRSRRRSRSKKRAHRSRSPSRRSHRHRSYRKRCWSSKSASRSRSNSKERDDYIRKCRSVQGGPELKESKPANKRNSSRRRSRSRSRSTSAGPKALPSSSQYLAIEGPEMSKALVTLYPSDTPSLPMPTLDRVRLPAALAQQLFPVSCGSEHKTEEQLLKEAEQKQQLLAITTGENSKGGVKEAPKAPSLSDIMQMRIEANKLLIKDKHDKDAQTMLREAQILMNKWQIAQKCPGGKYTGAVLTTPLTKDELDTTHPLSWARKDMFHNLQPVTESPGIALMKKMGWNQGQGLGKELHGDVNPLKLNVKSDRRGLMNQLEEHVPSKKKEQDRIAGGCNWVLKIINGKHAVSALGELHQHIGKPCPEYCDLVHGGVYKITCKTAWGEFCNEGRAANKKEAKGKTAHYAITQIILKEADKFSQEPPVESPTSGPMCVVFVSTRQTGPPVIRYNQHFRNTGRVPNPAAIRQIRAVRISPRPLQAIPHIPPPAQQTCDSFRRQSLHTNNTRQQGFQQQTPPQRLQKQTRPRAPSHIPPHLQRANAKAQQMTNNHDAQAFPINTDNDGESTEPSVQDTLTSILQSLSTQSSRSPSPRGPSPRMPTPMATFSGTRSPSPKGLTPPRSQSPNTPYVNPNIPRLRSPGLNPNIPQSANIPRARSPAPMTRNSANSIPQPRAQGISIPPPRAQGISIPQPRAQGISIPQPRAQGISITPPRAQGISISPNRSQHHPARALAPTTLSMPPPRGPLSSRSQRSTVTKPTQSFDYPQQREQSFDNALHSWMSRSL